MDFKSFLAHDLTSLESLMKEWIEKNNVTVIHFSHSHSQTVSGGVRRNVYTAMILFEEISSLKLKL